MLRGLCALVSILSAAVAAPAAPAAAAEPVVFERFGVYLLVEDVQRASAFYEALFSRPPQVRTPALVGFDVAGGLFGIVPRAAFAPDARRGTTVRPYIKVASIAAAYEHVQRVARGCLRTGIVEEGPFSFFRIVDPEGNVVEFFAVVSA